MLGTTFGGNHLGCAAALAVLHVMKHERLVENAGIVGSYLYQKLSALSSPMIKEVRGRGLMIGVEFTVPVSTIRESLLFTHHIFTGYSGTNTLRLLPPLCITKNEVDSFINALSLILNNMGI